VAALSDGDRETMINFWLADLRWLLLAPPLLNPKHADFEGKIVLHEAAELDQIDAWLLSLEAPLQREKLSAWMASKPAKQIVRLGRYAEHLIEFYLRFGPLERLVAANLQIRAAALAMHRKDFTTIGEVDFLLRDASDKPFHWELAVKYFVCRDVPKPRVDDLVGPDSAETFDQKIDKVMGKQLVQTPPSPYDQTLWQPQAFTRGWMFYRRGKDMPVIEELAINHLNGFWIEHKDITELASGHYYIVPRARWLSPVILSSHAAAELIDLSTLYVKSLSIWANQIALSRWPGGVLVARVEAQEEGWIEVDRGFVMPDNWQLGRHAIEHSMQEMHKVMPTQH
jgi:uncharacterized protein